jgi:hypothetical protein
MKKASLFVISIISSLILAAQTGNELPQPPLSRPVLLFQNDECRIFAACPTRKILPGDDLYQSPDLLRLDKIVMSAARNESEQVELVIRPVSTISGIKLRFSGLEGPGKISADAWSWQLVRNVEVKQISYWYGVKGYQTGMIPDPLDPVESCDAAAGENTTLLLQVKVPAGIPAGVYKGNVEVLSAQDAKITIPLELNVWDITLPKEPTLDTYTAAPPKKYYSDLKRLGITSLKYGGWGFKSHYDKKTGKISIDTKEYGKSLHKVFDEMGFRTVAIPGKLLGIIHTLDQDYLGTGIPVGDKKFWPVMEQYMKQLGEFYRANKWQNKIRWRIMDEIEPEHYPVLTKICKEAKRVFPEVKIMLTTHQMPDELAEVIDIWVIPWHFFYTQEKDAAHWRQLQKRGMKLHAYMNSLYTLNAAWSSSAMRIFGPALVKYGYGGALWWGYNYYGKTKQDPWKEGIITYSRPKKGKKKAKRIYANGYLFYPPRPNDPHYRSSLRWENYRQGLDDAELMLTLGKRIEKVGKALKASEDFSTESALYKWGSMLAGGFRLQTYRQDGAYIQRFRQLLANEIINMPLAPLALIDVEPSGWLTEDDSVKIRGLAAAGTRVEINGRKIQQSDANKAFVFTVDQPLKPGRNTIVIRLTAPDGHSKVFYREIEKK